MAYVWHDSLTSLQPPLEPSVAVLDRPSLDPSTLGSLKDSKYLHQ
jgi:hypothetical protein